MVCSYDGKFLITAGGADRAVNMWTVDLENAPVPINLFDSLAALIEGGKEGEFWRDIEDYFNYAQIRR